jgi:ectoine hydroxylase-related dioxygenase (phytanoyl-CoA dioxygenase family)
LLCPRGVYSPQALTDYKQAFAGGFAPHFDAPGYNHIKAQKHLTILIGVEDATLENGCLEVVPGSHASTIPINPDKTITDEWAKSKEWISVPLKTGQCFVFTSYPRWQILADDTA